jgi:hypothetical protein
MALILMHLSASSLALSHTHLLRPKISALISEQDNTRRVRNNVLHWMESSCFSMPQYPTNSCNFGRWGALTVYKWFRVVFLSKMLFSGVLLLLFLGVGWHWVHFERGPLFVLLYQNRTMDYDECGAVDGMGIGKGKPKYSYKIYPTATSSTTNPKWPDLGSNPGCRGGKPATNGLSGGKAFGGFLHMSAALTKEPWSISVYGLLGIPIQPRRGFLKIAWPDVTANRGAYLTLSTKWAAATNPRDGIAVGCHGVQLPEKTQVEQTSVSRRILWTRVSQHIKIKQDRRSFVYIRFII